MAKLSRKRGIQSQILHVFIQDSSSTVGAGLTGLLFSSAGLACKYINAGGTLSGAITLEDITTLGTYQAPTLNTNIRFKEVNSASPSQGVYEIHVHNDWMNLTGGSLVIMLAGATNMAQFRLEIDLQADVNMTHVAGTTQTAGDLATMITVVDDFVDTEVTAIKTKTDFLPSVTAGAAGGLMIAGSNAATTFATLTVTGATTFTGNVAYQAGITITQSTLNGHGISTTGNGTGAGIYTVGGATGIGMNAIGGATSGDGIKAQVTSGIPINGNITGNVTGNLSGSVGSVTGAVDSVTGAVGSVTGAVGSVTGLTASNLDAAITTRATPAQVLTTTLTESYAADGVVPTLAQLLFMLWSALAQFSISGTTITSQKLDGTTAAMTFTLNDGTNPTSRNRDP